jgi:hypothetical protein
MTRGHILTKIHYPIKSQDFGLSETILIDILLFMGLCRQSFTRIPTRRVWELGA